MAEERSRASDALDLLDWKRRVFALYQEVRAEPDPERGWARWRDERDRLFATHPQTPLPPDRRGGFAGLDLYPYDPALRVTARVEAVADQEEQRVGTSGAAPIAFRRVGVAVFALAGAEQRLDLHWLEAYGGGLFVPLGDTTNGHTTYGGGRYVLDTVKGADLGATDAGELVLDLNFAYNPSCCYDPRWTCPLAPPGSRLRVPVHAGERQFR